MKKPGGKKVLFTRSIPKALKTVMETESGISEELLRSLTI